MWAAVYYGPNDLRLEERPLPTIGPDDVLLKVISTGICGTDLRILHGEHRKYPPGTVRVPGHEVVGDIAEIGAEVVGLHVGQRVVIAPNFGCGHCRQCVSGHNNRCANYGAIGINMDGSFAEYVRIPGPIIAQGGLIPVDNRLDPAVVALVEPFACVLRGQDPLHITPGDVVLVMGAGPIGTMHMLLARLRGARRVIVSDLISSRLQQVAALGADRVVNIAEEDLTAAVMEESRGEGADAIIVATAAHQAQEQALSLAAIGGRINYFGGLPKDRPTVTFNSNLVHYKELVVTGTTACSTADCWRAAEIIGSGRINLEKLVSGRYPLRGIHAAFAAAEGKNALKIVIQPDLAEPRKDSTG
jgi:L-iditol 2-dehydrogenase